MKTLLNRFGSDYIVLLRQGDVVMVERSKPCPPEIDGCGECEHCREIQEERAGIHQFDGGATREQAEALAARERCVDHSVRKQFDVCVVQKHPARELGGLPVPARESLPKEVQSFFSGDAKKDARTARIRFDDLAMDLFPDSEIKDYK